MSEQHPLFARPLPKGWQLFTVDGIKTEEPSSCVAGPFGSNISSKYFVPEGVPVIRGNNLRDDLMRFVPTGLAFVSEERARQYRSQHVKAGDLVFTCRWPIGQVGLIPREGPFPEYIISNKQLKLRPNRKVADPLFLFYYFASPQMVRHIRSIAIGAAVPGINLGLLKSLPIPLPPIPEQKKIAAILLHYDDLIENNTRRIGILEEMAQAIFREWFVRFRFPGHKKVKLVPSPLGQAPEGWIVGRLDEAVVLQRRFDLPNRNRRVGNVPVYAATGVVGRHNEAKVNGPGVVIGRSGSLGTVIYIPEDYWPLNTTLWVKEFRRSTPLHAYFLPSTLDFEQFNSGAAVPTLNRNNVHGLPVVLPPKVVLAEFDKQVEPIYDFIGNLKTKNVNLRRTRDLLLPKLISGELDVSDVDINVGDAAA